MISKDRLYIQKQIYNFLRTVTIKYEPLADNINANVISRGYAVNDLDKTTWKYYLNMTGRYHVSDTLMYVTSLDTQDPILFSPDVLKTHPRTRSVYVPGGLYYSRLCETYPDQVDLIKSILFPVPDIQKAIQSEDLTLLSYGSGYLEEYEQPRIIMDIEEFLVVLKERWYFDFLDDEPLFHLTFFGSLWTYLAMLIMSSRETYIKTPHVHSWHVWSYLKSKGLSDYSDILNREKSMMLYQNIDYIKDNAGKHSNLIILANRLLDDFGISIYGRKIVQESETANDAYQLTPQLEAVRIPTNSADITTEIASETVATIQNRLYEKGLTPENTAESFAATTRRLGDTTLNEFNTKLLEIRPITKNKVYADILNMFLFETLLTAIHEGYYNQPVNVVDNSTGVALYLYPKELIAIYAYAVQRSLGFTPENIPTKMGVYKAFTPTVGTPAKTIMWDDEIVYISSKVDVSTFFDGVEYNTNIETPTEFSTMLTTQWLTYLKHFLMDQQTKDDHFHLVLEYLSSLCHQRRELTLNLVPGFTTYEDWFGIGGIDIRSSIVSQYDIQLDPKAAWGNLADSIISALVPITDTLSDFGNFTLSDFGYTRLRQLFVQLCSYKVVFLESSRDTPDFAIGAKWSTKYGPDDTMVFSDDTIIRYQFSTDNTINQGVLHLHNGVCTEYLTNMRDSSKYTVNFSTTYTQTSMQQPTENIEVRTTEILNSSSSGDLVLEYAGMEIDGIM